MRKFALLSIIMGLAGLTTAEAQVRDLFAEFEEEANAAESSSSVMQSSSSEIASSSSVAVSSSSIAVSSSSVAISSSSLAVSSSSMSSSSVAVSSSSIAPTSSSVLESSSSLALSSSSETAPAVAPVDSAIGDSLSPEESYARAMQNMSDSLQFVNDSIALEQMKADSIAKVEQHAKDSVQAYNDSLKAASSSSAVIIPSSSSMSRRDILGPVKVSKVNGLDDMKGKYKSPRKAMFMSLVIPGSGQMYVGGSTFTYVRGGVYLALEAALWGSWYYFSVYKYDKQVKNYKKFAKSHFSIGKYEQGMRDLYDADAVNYESEFRTRYLGSRETFCEGIFGTATLHGCYDKTDLYHNDTEYMNDFVKNPKKLGNEMKKVSFYDASVVFQQIADEAYVLGWDDVSDVAVATNLGLEDPNSETVSLGSSENLKTYRSMRNKANDYADMQAWFFGGIILNHIVSAVDAAFTAYSHNKALYQEDLSWYDHLHFDGGVFINEGVGLNVQANWGF